ncbi:hypothetical protein KFE25_007932 [Diacronema lutheri]|uniref:Nop domain-containing protein n=1 Tax=Diacronema lutheri TaxID=2081491 RepID=A0A8J6CGC0_DIALT|nr:hypothetical protein KFE25_007932 [Diacronema lutheri]
MLTDFLADLDDLDGEGGEEEHGGEGEGHDADGGDGVDRDVPMGEAGGSAPAVVRAAPTGLLRSARLQELVTTVKSLVAAGPPDGSMSLGESHPEYAAIVACNEVCLDIDSEIDVLVRCARAAYAKRFPELESLVVAPLDYARVVLKIGDEADLTAVELAGIVPAATVMVVTVTASTTSGAPLPAEALANTIDQCRQAVELADCKAQLQAYVETRMHAVAPNLTTIVGADVAARLIGTAGGLTKLAGLPAGVVQSLGVKRRTLGGLASGGQLAHTGHIMGCALLQGTPPALRTKVARLLSGRCTLAARVDGFRSAGGEVDSSVGAKFREEILGKLDKWQEPRAFKVAKALPIPEGKTSRKRGGARARKQRERTQVTEMRVQANRVTFGVAEDTFGLDEEGIGTLAKGQGSGKLRIAAKQTKVANHTNKRIADEAKRAGPSGGATGGLTSTLAFTPVQGIELVNPRAQAEQSEGTDTYFSRAASFFSKERSARV